jgi:hypothetical protein
VDKLADVPAAPNMPMAAAAAAAAVVPIKMEVDALNSSTSCSDVNMFELDQGSELLLLTAGSGCGAMEGRGLGASDVQLMHDTDAYFA